MKNLNEETKCLQCGKSCSKYIARNYNRLRQFCSNKCRQISYIGKRSGENSPVWKGDKAGKEPKHQWIHRYFGKAFMCFSVDCNKKSKTFDWANIDHKYRRNIDDWIMLCRSCHGKHDGWIDKCISPEQKMKGLIKRWGIQS